MIHVCNIKGVAGDDFMKFNFATEQKFAKSRKFSDAKISQYTVEPAKISLRTMDYKNRLKKFMQVEVDVKCMETNFGRCGFSKIGIMSPFKNGQISLSDHLL